MILLLDIGNTRVKWAQLLEGALTPQQSLLHRDVPVEEWTRQLFRERFRPQRLLVANVAGAAMETTIRGEAQRLWQLTPEFAVSQAYACEVTNAYPQPTSLGVDRWLTLIAAHHLAPGWACIIDAGTALTIDGLDAAGLHLGGLIIPGSRMMMDALLDGTGDIARKAREYSSVASGNIAEKGVFANDTARAVASGAFYALAAAADRAVVDLARRAGGDAPRVYLTGGDAEQLKRAMTSAAEIVPDLVLRGLAVTAGHA
ncbi:MAG TPA: type III pantothenate kinase [Steroidobacteraceae bacterium]|jgi:type III pantothenate kinase|nr:type III pantothenate kinase [Steroidobacteraceae bacterium]